MAWLQATVEMMSNSTLPLDFIHKTSLAISLVEVASLYFFILLDGKLGRILHLGCRDEVDNLVLVPTDLDFVIGVNDEL